MSINRNLSNFADNTGAPNAPTINVPNIGETATVSATAATGTINYDVLTQSTLYYTTAATGDFTLNFRGNASTAFNAFLPIGQAVDVKYFVTNGATAYKLSAINIDGTAQTIKWAGGTAPSAGTASAVDEYNITIIKTAASTYTVYAASSIVTSSGTSSANIWSAAAAMNGSTTTGQQMQSVAVNSSGLCVAGGVSGLIATSTDGINWTTPARPAALFASSGTVRCIGVSSTNVFYAAVAAASLGVRGYATSTDGVTWTTSLFNGSTVNGNMYGVAISSSGRIVFVGANYFTTSADGTTWTTPAPFSSATFSANAVCVNSAGLFVAVGSDSSSGPSYSTSVDGSTWTPVANFNGFAPGNVGSVNGVAVNSSGRFVAVGNINTYGSSLYTTSTDGTTWTTPTSFNGLYQSFNVRGITVNSAGKFIAVGSGSDNLPIYTASNDGVTWSNPQQMGDYPATGSPFGVTIAPSGKFIAVGQGAVQTTSLNWFTV